MAGRGRGGGLKGATWEYDPTVKLENAPSALFPVIYRILTTTIRLLITVQTHPNLKKPKPLTLQELGILSNQKSHQTTVHRGPLYTAPTKRDANAPAKFFSEEQYNSQYGTNSRADVDPFTAVPTYTNRYDPPKRDLPGIKNMKFNKSMFPKELWGTLEGDRGEELKAHIGRAMDKKAKMMDGLKKAAEGQKNGDPTEKTRVLLEKFDSVAGEDVEEEAEEGDHVEEEQDDDYEEDEEDMGGDYDAEKYFDDGEGGEEDEDGGGGEDY